MQGRVSLRGLEVKIRMEVSAITTQIRPEAHRIIRFIMMDGGVKSCEILFGRVDEFLAAKDSRSPGHRTSVLNSSEQDWHVGHRQDWG